VGEVAAFGPKSVRSQARSVRVRPLRSVRARSRAAWGLGMGIRSEERVFGFETGGWYFSTGKGAVG
jgi:hypothetical protein